MRLRRSLGHDNRLLAAGAAFVLVYIAVLVEHGSAKPEIYPFSHWELFSRVPDRQGTDYSIRFTRVNGQSLDPPLYFADADDLGVPSDSPIAIQVIQDLGRALQGRRSLQADAARRLFETTYINALQQADYEVVRRRYDRIDRFTCDCFLEETVLAQFTLDP